MDQNALLDFAIEAVAALIDQCTQLSRQPRADAFYLALKTHLNHVRGRLNRRASCDIDRILALLEALERIAKVSINIPVSRPSASVLLASQH